MPTKPILTEHVDLLRARANAIKTILNDTKEDLAGIIENEPSFGAILVITIEQTAGKAFDLAIQYSADEDLREAIEEAFPE